MVEPKAPAAARIMAANALLDRGWGKAAQLVEVEGEIRQLVEVKLNVVQATPAASHTLPNQGPPCIEHSPGAGITVDEALTRSGDEQEII
jgi:hypothetical protein